MSCPLITIVTPSYNQGRFIGETIESVISQEGDFLVEYIIMDGGSTDESVEVIKKYERLLKDGSYPVRCKGIEYKWVSEKDRGQAHAVNKGFRLAKGEILGWVNSDDVYYPGAVAKAIEYLEKHNDVMMVYGEGNYIDEHGKIIERYRTEPFDHKRFADYCFICQPSAFFRRKVLDEVGYLDEKLNFCMDLEYWIRVGKAHKVGFIPEYFSGSRLYADTKTMSKAEDAALEALKTVKKHYGYVRPMMVNHYAHMVLRKYFKKRDIISVCIFHICREVLLRYKLFRFNARSCEELDSKRQ